MMNVDVYSIMVTRRAELERALRRQELLRGAGVTAGPSLASRLMVLTRRLAERAGTVRPTPVAPAYTRTSCVREPV